jgi:hypothetical protein
VCARSHFDSSITPKKNHLDIGHAENSHATFPMVLTVDDLNFIGHILFEVWTCFREREREKPTWAS